MESHKIMEFGVDLNLSPTINLMLEFPYLHLV